MPSGEFGTEVDSELNSLGINTNAEVQTFRALARHQGDMDTVLSNIQTTRTQLWVSRKRMRSDALRLLREGAL